MKNHVHPLLLLAALALLAPRGQAQGQPFVGLPAPTSVVETPLMRAATRGDVPLCRLLLSRGADPSARDPSGVTALMEAASGGSVGLTDARIAGGDPLFSGPPPLRVFPQPSDPKLILTLLLAHGARVNAQDKFGRTALWWAVRTRDTAKAALLLSRRADPELGCSAPAPFEFMADQAPPLLLAVGTGQVDMARLLLAHHADPNRRSALGADPPVEMTPLSLALKQKSPEMRDLLQAAAQRAARYAVTDLGTLGGDGSRALGINSKGQVVGSADTAGGHAHAFLWESGKMRDLGTLGGDTSEADAINDRGEVVGISRTEKRASQRSGFSGLAFREQIFLWRGGTLRGIAAGLVSADGRVAKFFPDFAFNTPLPAAINTQGHIVGETQSLQPVIIRGNRVSVLTPLGDRTDSSGWMSGARGVNDKDVAVGFAQYGIATNYLPHPPQESGDFAVCWENGRERRLACYAAPAVSGNFFLPSVAWAINNRGQIVGWAGRTAVLWEGNSVRALGPAEGDRARAINEHAQVVGVLHKGAEFTAAAKNTTTAFLWENGAMRDLNDLIAPGSGWTLEEARGINDAGRIVGWGRRGGKEHAFLLTPIRAGK